METSNTIIMSYTSEPTNVTTLSKLSDLWVYNGAQIYIRRLKLAMSAIKSVFLSATPFDHTQLCHVLPHATVHA